jgi:integrase
MPEQQRLDLLNRLLRSDDVDIVDRVAGCLILLYALPSSRIHRLRLTDVHPGPDGLMIQLGADPVPVPAPLSDLITELADRRHTTRGLTGEWLFPGRIPGQPIEPDQLVERLNRLGITRAARTAALNALLRQVPSPVLAKVLNRRPWRVTARAKTLGTDWNNYAALRVQT